jgi:hypothetical protein
MKSRSVAQSLWLRAALLGFESIPQLPVQLVPGASFPGDKATGTYSPPSNAEVKNGLILLSLSNTFSWRGA